jgi:two-component system, chemotaxis family, chemotaxis protein CheY
MQRESVATCQGYKMTLSLLAVDDDPSSAELVVRVAERCGFEAFATSDSRGVVELIRQLDPDIFAVDICMPNVDALELFRLLSEDKFGGSIIIVSGQDESTLFSAARYAEELGLKRPKTMQKPLNFQDLRGWLNSVNDSRQAA